MLIASNSSLNNDTFPQDVSCNYLIYLRIEETKQQLSRLQSKSVRTLEYCKTETTVHYSKHKSLEIPSLFKLLVSKLMYSFHGGALPSHIDDYFAEIASV